MRSVVDQSRYRNPDDDPRGPWLAADITAPFYRPAHIYEWGGQVPPEGRSWRYSREKMAELAADSRLDVREGRRPRLKRYLADIAIAENAPPEEQVELPVVAIVAEFSRALARRLALSPSELADVEWRDLERLLAEVCDALGFGTTLTRSGKDGGFDLELRADGSVYLVEVKHWSLCDPGRSGEAA